MRIVSDERVKAMYDTFTKLSTVSKVSQPFSTEGLSGHQTELKLDMTIPEALIGLGVAKDEEEAEVFLMHVIGGAISATAVGKMNPNQLLYDLVKTGFALGLLAGKPREGTV